MMIAKKIWFYYMSNIVYDFIIIGAGPTGLALAWFLQKISNNNKNNKNNNKNNKNNNKILILEREASIGGCHRVRRVDGYFSEHGPRVYLDNYVYFQAFLDDILETKDSFHHIFTEYKFGGADFIRYLRQFSLSEIASLGWAMMKFMVNPSYGKEITMKEFTRDAGFSQASRDYIDRLCILTDGGTSERYTVNQFLEIANQNLLYKIYQPRASNDLLLWPQILQRLTDRGVETIQGQVIEILASNGLANGVKLADGGVYYGRKVIAAIPPKSLQTILSNSPLPIKYAFGKDFVRWSDYTAYDTYIPMVFYFPYTSISSVWGVPSSDWGIASIVLSDYFGGCSPSFRKSVSCNTLEQTRSLQTVITVAITMVDRVSGYTGKTANQTSDRNELIVETFRQLNEIYHGKLPNPLNVVVSPEVTYTDGHYHSSDTAYFNTILGPMRESSVPNFYSVGVQNGNSEYAFTSLEAAVANAHYFVKQQYPTLKIPEPKMLWTLRKLLLLVGAIILVLSIVIYYFRAPVFYDKLRIYLQR